MSNSTTGETAAMINHVTTTASKETTSRRWTLPFLAALVAILATVFGAASASAATTPGAETRVRASQSVAQDIARPPEDIRAGQRLGNEPAGVATAVATGVAAKSAMDIRPPLSIGTKQFGTKWGKHASDYGLDPASSSSRSWFQSRARDVHLNPSEVRRGAWNPSGGGGENYFFFRQGDDLLITQPGGEFVTMFPGGGSNTWFKNAEVFPH